MGLRDKLFTNRPVKEFNDMTPEDALEELQSWDFCEAFGDDAERLSDAIKRLELMVYETRLNKDYKTGLVVLNEKFNILADVKFLDEAGEEYKEIHFYDSTGKEFYANLGDYPGDQDDMEEELEMIISMTKGEQLYKFIKEYGTNDGTVFRFSERLYISC